MHANIVSYYACFTYTNAQYHAVYLTILLHFLIIISIYHVKFLTSLLSDRQFMCKDI